MNSDILQRAKKEYYAREGAKWKDEAVRCFAPELTQMEMLTDIQVVAEVREHPNQFPEIHKRLMWSDQTAAELYRALEVQVMRRSVMLRIIPEDGSEVIETRAFLRVRPDTVEEDAEPARPNTPRIGITLERALENRDKVGPEIIAEAKRMLLGLRRRYSGYLSLFAEEEPILFDLFERIGNLEKSEKEEAQEMAAAGD